VPECVPKVTSGASQLLPALIGTPMSLKQDASHISGNASDEVKRVFSNPGDLLIMRPTATAGPIFGESIVKKMMVTEIAVEKKVEEPQKLEGRFICEITVGDGSSHQFFYLSSISFGLKDMVNGGGNMHGGCSAFLVDV
jgi:acyl-coenzyme A thioesterase 13